MITFSIQVQDDGQVSIDSNSIHDPMRLLGLLKVGEELIINNFLKPQIYGPSSPVVVSPTPAFTQN